MKDFFERRRRMKKPANRIKVNLNPAEPVWCGLCNVRIAQFEATVRMAGNKVLHGHCADRVKDRRQAAGSGAGR
jgi:hypothetical protein